MAEGGGPPANLVEVERPASTPSQSPSPSEPGGSRSSSGGGSPKRNRLEEFNVSGVLWFGAEDDGVAISIPTGKGELCPSIADERADENPGHSDVGAGVSDDDRVVATTCAETVGSGGTGAAFDGAAQANRRPCCCGAPLDEVGRVAMVGYAPSCTGTVGSVGTGSASDGVVSTCCCCCGASGASPGEVGGFFTLGFTLRGLPRPRFTGRGPLTPSPVATFNFATSDRFASLSTLEAPSSPATPVAAAASPAGVVLAFADLAPAALAPAALAPPALVPVAFALAALALAAFLLAALASGTIAAAPVAAAAGVATAILTTERITCPS